MRNEWRISALTLGVALAAFPSTVFAQQAPPFDSAIDVQTFEYAIGPKTFFTVADADVADKKQLSVDALFTYLTKPFKVFNVTPDDMVGTERVTVVESLVAAQLTAAYGITDKIHIGARLPLIFSLNGDGLDPSTGMAAMGGLSVTGLGDLLVEGKMRLYRQNKVRAAAMAGVTIPTSFGSDGSQFIGDNLPTARIGFALQLDPSSRFSVGTNVGFHLRKPRTIYDSTIGPQFVWGVAAAGRVTERFSLIGEAYGRTAFDFSSLDAAPLELEGGLRVFVTNAVAVVVGGGAGVVKGIGSPEARFFVSLGYSPDVRDSDGDGVPNSRDKCLLVAEDKDGIEDDDGCPDDDNDGDRRPDDTDKCPTQAEDLDGFEDDDGCPELDNDKDTFADLQDKCPNDAEDGKEPAPKDGCPASKRDTDGDGINDALDKCPTEEEDMDSFQDDDGCPEPDNDNDGVLDASDKCNTCPEDRDSFQDEDGCPDLDNDKDGIADTADACPMQPETVNGVKDDDGCPDTGGVTVAKLDGDRLVMDKMPTMVRGVLTASGAVVVDQVARVMIAHDEVTKWVVALAQPKAADATVLAGLVKARLVAKGVPEDRIQVIGAAGQPKIGGVVQERGEVDVAKTCAASAKAPVAPLASDGDKDDDDIPDSVDKCVDQPETLNGYIDDDGCPDSVPVELQKFSGSVAGVNFKSGSAELLPVSLKVLDDAVKALSNAPTIRIEIQGHTDDAPLGKGGKFADNTALSQARAESVRDYLVSKGLDASRMTAKGYGETKPSVQFKDLKGAALNNARIKNRRVEFKLGEAPKP
ncbi:MAG: OmpA family protein [Deltaproteobacteria bacterium]|nr:OmpA family protein [Deltaproteobacteria bacterium]